MNNSNVASGQQLQTSRKSAATTAGRSVVFSENCPMKGRGKVKPSKGKSFRDGLVVCCAQESSIEEYQIWACNGPQADQNNTEDDNVKEGEKLLAACDKTVVSEILD